MNTAAQTKSITDDLQHLVFEPNAIRSVIILLIALIAAFFLSRLIARIIVKIAQVIAVHSDNESNELRQARLRQTETYLSITIAIVRFFVVVIGGCERSAIRIYHLISQLFPERIGVIGLGGFGNYLCALFDYGCFGS